MRNAEQSPDQPSDLTRVMPADRRPGPENGTGTGPGTSRIRYAHGGMLPRVGPFCPVSRATPVHHGANRDEFSGEPWAARFPVAGVTGHRNDLWVLVCGGIAAVAAFAAAFVASGGVVSHPATPSAVPAVVSQACPSPAAGLTPGLTPGLRSGPTP